jgi:RHS repeat-associated protein
LGTVAALTWWDATEEQEKLVEEYSYDAYGFVSVVFHAPSSLVPGLSSRVGNPYTFTARALDGETGLMYYRARYYSPVLGRFISRDPLGYVDGMNLYAAYFVPNSTDPHGLAPGKGGKGSIWDRLFPPKFSRPKKPVQTDEETCSCGANHPQGFSGCNGDPVTVGGGVSGGGSYGGTRSGGGKGSRGGRSGGATAPGKAGGPTGGGQSGSSSNNSPSGKANANSPPCKTGQNASPGTAEPAQVRLGGEPGSTSVPGVDSYFGGYDPATNTAYFGGTGFHPVGMAQGGGNPSAPGVAGITLLTTPHGVYWANDSVSLGTGLTPGQAAQVQAGLQNMFPKTPITQVPSVSDVHFQMRK